MEVVKEIMLVKQDGDLGRTNLHSCFLNYGNMSALVKNKILFFFFKY